MVLVFFNADKPKSNTRRKPNSYCIWPIHKNNASANSPKCSTQTSFWSIVFPHMEDRQIYQTRCPYRPQVNIEQGHCSPWHTIKWFIKRRLCNSIWHSVDDKAVMKNQSGVKYMNFRIQWHWIKGHMSRIKNYSCRCVSLYRRLGCILTLYIKCDGGASRFSFRILGAARIQTGTLALQLCQIKCFGVFARHSHSLVNILLRY